MNTFIHIPCANKERIPSLLATLTSILQVRNLHVSVSYNQDSTADFDAVNDGKGIATWKRLFAYNNSTFEVIARPGLSVAQMYKAALESAINYQYLIKIDDDCLVYDLREFLAFLSMESPRYATFNFWDIDNIRQYDDWRAGVPVSYLPQMVAQYGERTLWCHRWDFDIPALDFVAYSPETKVNASMFAVRLESVQQSLLDSLQAIGVGQRGMDLCVSESFNRWPRFHYLKTVAWHTGVHRPQLDGKYWNSFHSDDAVIKQSGFIRSK